ncbi:MULTISPECIES: D-aminoacyl-tRNA deacylase [Prauserella salsuginis group]|uniref:D-aminoacyl-tRNA deacylase n=1 Tax=Prauserella salsuginis TaxID=387889 RepID=A0ABW6G2X9_9PSEU|nr:MULTISPECIES: D-aminoacyl-tRNA deacylase [Prauserella salsuginis group]MCR3718436.1 D-tyrosyl-tRNA(Tyr) deacylase [Prauserella flava]MCR3733006.1 D-tyrosyl-tRNA(Tyr) deacylase [Prauserella salsuginis]
MKAVVTRVTEATVTVGGEVVGALDKPGLLVLLGIHTDDTSDKADTMARKLHEMRLLRDDESCATADAPLLVVSQFTLHGDTRKGRRPSWTAAARPEHAEPLVNAVVAALAERGAHVETGRFGAMMQVHSVNDGPFTVLVDV